MRYTKKETYGEMTEGTEEARELSVANYGRDEWWLLLDPVPRCEYVEVLEVPRVPTVGARTVSLFKPQRFLLSHQGESTTNTSTREGVLARVLAS